MTESREQRAAVWLERVLYLFCAIFVGRAIVGQNIPNFDMHAYAHGVTIMPFQARYLMSPVLRWAEGNHALIRASAMLKHSVQGGAIELALQLVDVFCLIVLGWLAPRIRECFEPRAVFHCLPRWLLIWIVVMTYVVRNEQAFYTPYDMTSILLFNTAIYFCIRGNIWLYLLSVSVGMFNRETVVFLLFIWLACNVQRSRVKAVAGAIATAAYYFFAKWQIAHILGRPETNIGSAWMVNKTMLLPHHWPQILSLGGFLALPLLFNVKRFKDDMLRKVWLGLVPWFLAAVYFGWWNETRVFGEASVLFACTSAILFEMLIRDRFATRVAAVQ